MNRFIASLLILASAALQGCGKSAIGGTGTGTSTATSSDTTDSSNTAGSTGSATVTMASTSTVTVTHTESITVTATQTVPTTVTATQSVTSTRTNTITNSTTLTITNTVTNTLTSTLTNTVTSTVTATSTDSSLVKGNYQSDNCYLDRLASDRAGQSVYLRTTFHFSGGSGHKKISQYSDENCEKAVSRANLKLSYSYAGSRGGLFVFRIDQDNEEKSGGPTQRYWLVAIEQDGAFRFALDGEHGQGAYLSEPDDRELREASELLGTYGVWFR
jgi:hypothetical protein